MMRGCALAACLVLASCEPLPPDSLNDVVFSDEAHLDVHRSVALHVTPDVSAEHIAVSLVDGTSVYRGPILPASAYPLVTSLAVDVAVLAVDVRWRDGAHGVGTVEVNDGVARIDLADLRGAP